jgi:hypothetical protein
LFIFLIWVTGPLTTAPFTAKAFCCFNFSVSPSLWLSSSSQLLLLAVSYPGTVSVFPQAHWLVAVPFFQVPRIAQLQVIRVLSRWNLIVALWTLDFFPNASLPH